MKNLIGMLGVVLLIGTSAVAQQNSNSRDTTGNRTTQPTTGNVGTGLTTDQVNAANATAAGAADKGATSTTRPNTSVPNSNNGTNAAVGTGNTLDQNAGSVTPGAGGNSVTPATKTDNTSSVIKGHATDVKPKKIKPGQ